MSDDNGKDKVNTTLEQIEARLKELLAERENLEQQIRTAEADKPKRNSRKTGESLGLNARVPRLSKSKMKLVAHYDGHSMNDGIAVPPLDHEPVYTDLNNENRHVYCAICRCTHPIKEAVFVSFGLYEGGQFVCRKKAKKYGLQEYVVKFNGLR